MRLGERHRRIEVVRLGLQGSLEQRRVEVGRAEVADDVDSVLLGKGRDGVGITGIDLLRHEARVVQLGAELLRAGRVVVGHDRLYLAPLTLGVRRLAMAAIDWPTPPVRTMRAFISLLLQVRQDVSCAPAAETRSSPAGDARGRRGRLRRLRPSTGAVRDIVEDSSGLSRAKLANV